MGSQRIQGLPSLLVSSAKKKFDDELIKMLRLLKSSQELATSLQRCWSSEVFLRGWIQTEADVLSSHLGTEGLREGEPVGGISIASVGGARSVRRRGNLVNLGGDVRL